MPYSGPLLPRTTCLYFLSTHASTLKFRTLSMTLSRLASSIKTSSIRESKFIILNDLTSINSKWSILACHQYLMIWSLIRCYTCVISSWFIREYLKGRILKMMTSRCLPWWLMIHAWIWLKNFLSNLKKKGIRNQTLYSLKYSKKCCTISLITSLRVLAAPKA